MNVSPSEDAKTSPVAHAAPSSPDSAPDAMRPDAPPHGSEAGPTTEVVARWGETPGDHFGYASDEERLARRGLEDWELVQKIPEAQRRVPYWFIAVVVIVLLVSLGLGFPFWGQRPGVHVQWFNWGYISAIFYVAGAAFFVYYMTNLYGSERVGRLDGDPALRDEPARSEDDASGPEKPHAR